MQIIRFLSVYLLNLYFNHHQMCPKIIQKLQYFSWTHYFLLFLLLISLVLYKVGDQVHVVVLLESLVVVGTLVLYLSGSAELLLEGIVFIVLVSVHLVVPNEGVDFGDHAFEDVVQVVEFTFGQLFTQLDFILARLVVW